MPDSLTIKNINKEWNHYLFHCFNYSIKPLSFQNWFHISLFGLTTIGA